LREWGRPLAVGGVVLAAVLGSLVVLRLDRRRAPAPAPAPVRAATPAPSLPATVHWSVVTRPAGAEIVRLADGVVLGRTPFEHDEPRGDGERVEVALRLAGHQELRAVLERGTGVVLREVLEPAPAEPAPPPERRPPRHRPDR